MANFESYSSTGHWPQSFRHFSLGDACSGIVTIAVILVILGAIYHNIFDTFAADDIFFKYTTNGSYSLALASYVNGRFVPGLLFQALSASGGQIHEFWEFLQGTAFVAIAVLSYVFVTCLNTRLTRLETLAVASIIAFIPYNVILLVNKNNALNATIGFISVCFAIYSFSKMKGLSRLLVTFIFLFFTISSYQTTIYYFIVFVLSFYLFNGTERRDVLIGLAQGAAACILSIAAYLVIYKVTLAWALTQLSQETYAQVAMYYGRPRSGLASLNEFGISVFRYIFTICRVMLLPEPILSFALKLLAATTFVVALHYWGSEKCCQAAPASAHQFLLDKQHGMALALILALGSPIHLALAYNSLPPRIYAHAGAVWAVFFMSTLILGPTNWRRAFLACAAIFSIGLAFYTARTTADIRDLYDRDIRLGRQIVAELKQLPGYQPRSPIAFAGMILHGSRHTSGIFDYYAMTPSKFAKKWAMIGFLEEASGERFARPSRNFVAIARKLCRKAPVGDVEYYVTGTEFGPVVCLLTSWLQPWRDS